MNRNFPEIHAHRGYTQKAPENTIPAFQLCVDHKVDSIEFDIHYSSDEQIVVHHDYYLGRTNNGKGLLCDSTFKELKLLDCGSWFNENFCRIKMPLLSEVLSVFRNKIKFEIQLCSFNKKFLNDTINTINDYKLLEDVEITSEYLPLLMFIKEAEPGLKTGIIFGQGNDWIKDDLWQKKALDILYFLNADIAHIPKKRFTDSIFNELKEKGFGVHIADCNEEKDIKNFLQWEIDQFSTDNLDLVLSIKDSVVNSKSTT